MKHEDFLITTTADNVSRKFIWDAKTPVELDMPHGWTIERSGKSFQLHDMSFTPAKGEKNESKVIALPKIGESTSIKLPKTRFGLTRPISVELLRLKSVDPIYEQTSSDDDITSGPRQLSMYYGQRYFLINYRPVSTKDSKRLKIVDFSYERSASGYTINVLKKKIKVQIGKKKKSYSAGSTLELTNSEFLAATFVTGVHWWRFRMVPTPNKLPPIETDESEADIREREHLINSAKTVFVFFLLLSAGILLYSYLNPVPIKVVQVDVGIKMPKLIPPLPVVKKIKPPPPPPKPPPPEKPKVVKKKPEPIKKPSVVKKTPKKPIKEPTPVPKPKPVVKKGPPPAPAPAMHTTGKQTKAPATTKADQLAKQNAAQQTQALKSLSFLSTSSKRPVSVASNYENTTGKFSNTPTVGGSKSTSKVLENIAKGAPGDGNIKTRSSREVVSQVSFGDGKGKGLNDVQGRVSLNDLASAGSRGESLGGGSGIELSGPGEISESAIEKALSKFLSRFQYCYEKALLSDAGLSGNIVIQWDITTSGSAKNSRVVKSQLDSKQLQGCITGVLSEVPFPKPKGGSVTVKKTFSFTSSSI